MLSYCTAMVGLRLGISEYSPVADNVIIDGLRNVECHLQSAALWRKFHQFGTEMIITKTGR